MNQQEPFQIFMPRRRDTSVVFASPHSGADYPRDMMRRTILDREAVRSSEDAFVDHLFDLAPVTGAPFLVATAPRAYVDLNRASDELDPALIEGLRRIGHNPRVASGLGVVPRVVAGGRAIYRGKLSLEDARGRIRDVWRPYHDALHGLMAQSMAEFGQAILVDCHSMPHEAVESLAHTRGGRPDVVLGDRFGAAASGAVVERIEAAFASAGLRVARNAPFAGAYIAQTYGRPLRRQHVVQIEIDRALYMDEAKIEPLPGFAAFKRVIDGVVAEISEIGRRDHALAAE
ncbi:N-formylglutamate amidohydrolase [Oceaniglobus trochenteri]|uniref:N-formylglutamate amidohydrolase n=1 Tax=Oceaniglobus trochenteri TaxID=2763260 RepID=UPI001D000227|nr:N-formylglutamate amidohydrolase [Oceaniglobus trochenteri]